MTLANGDRKLRPYVGPNGEGWRQIVDVLDVAFRKIDPDYRIHDVKREVRRIAILYGLDPRQRQR